MRVADVPPWVTFAARGAPPSAEVWGACARCGADQRVALAEHTLLDAQLALGRFARFHERCARPEERAAHRRAVREARAQEKARQVTTIGYFPETKR